MQGVKTSLCGFSLPLNLRNLSAIVKHTSGHEARSRVCGDDFNTILRQDVLYVEGKMS